MTKQQIICAFKWNKALGAVQIAFWCYRKGACSTPIENENKVDLKSPSFVVNFYFKSDLGTFTKKD